MKNKLIILLLLTAFGQAWAQDPVALPKWNSHVSAMVGLGMPSISDIRKPFQVTEQYRAILMHAGAGADCQFGSNWGVVGDLSVQYSDCGKTPSSWGRTGRQASLMLSVQGEMRWNTLYADAGVFASYNFYSDTSAEYLTGMIHYSRWQCGPAAGIGVRMPVGEANSLKIGLQCLWGVTAYVDYWENMASYDNIHTETLWEYNNRKIIPAYLLSLQLEFGTKHHE